MVRIIKKLVLVAMFGGLAAYCDVADAEITHGGPLGTNSGIGIGQKTELLSLQDKNLQSGGVSYTGLYGSGVKSGSAVTFSDLWNLGYTSSNFVLFLDLNQGQELTNIESIALNFYNPDAALPANAVFSISGGPFQGLEGGQGNSNWDHYFDVGFDNSQAEMFDNAANGSWLIGIDVVNMTGKSGQDVFGFSTVPEPSTVAIWSIFAGIGLLVGWRSRRRRAA